MKIIKCILGYCYWCEKYLKYPKRRRLISEWPEDKSREWIVSCRKCCEAVEVDRQRRKRG